MSSSELTLTCHTTAEAAQLMDELCEVYADAYGAVPGEDNREKSSAFRERATEALEARNYSLVTAEVGGRLVGFAFGYRRAVHDAFLSGRSEERATLASNPKATDTHALYERWGWQKMGTVPGKPGSYYPEYVRFVLPLPLPLPPAGR
ncbi:MAG: GNAT family N-acetyltransferase [Pseudonocardiales bacterium]